MGFNLLTRKNPVLSDTLVIFNLTVLYVLCIKKINCIWNRENRRIWINIRGAIEAEHMVPDKKLGVGKPGTNNTVTVNGMSSNRATTRDVQCLCE